MVKPADFVRLLSDATPGPVLKARNRAILEILFGCGLRRGELVGLDLSDVDATVTVLTLRHGKGGTRRQVPIAGEARKALVHYLGWGRPQLAHKQSGFAVFLAQTGRRLAAHTLTCLIGELARRAGFAGPVGPHRLRHGYATALVQGGADVRAVQELLGHRRLTTTQTYTHVDLADLQAVYRRTHPRERRR
jgi:site-specific recombinase XerD